MAATPDAAGPPATPWVVAHRGASAYAPENTIPAFTLAAEQGATFVEFDLQRTKDGALVLLHDTDARAHDRRRGGLPRSRPAGRGEGRDATAVAAGRLHAGRSAPARRRPLVRRALRGHAHPDVCRDDRGGARADRAVHRAEGARPVSGHRGGDAGRVEGRRPGSAMGRPAHAGAAAVVHGRTASSILARDLQHPPADPSALRSGRRGAVDRRSRAGGGPDVRDRAEPRQAGGARRSDARPPRARARGMLVTPYTFRASVGRHVRRRRRRDARRACAGRRRRDHRQPGQGVREGRASAVPCRRGGSETAPYLTKM